MKKSIEKIKDMTYIALFVAIISVASQFSIPTPTVPLSIQILIVSFTGFYLGLRKSITAILLYILLGIVGAPVFAGFRGGLQTILGPSGGFILGFIVIVVLCALFSDARLSVTMGILSVFVCHLIGVLQYMLIAETSFWVSFLSVSLPFLAKDIIFVPLAYILSKKLKKAIRK